MGGKNYYIIKTRKKKRKNDLDFVENDCESLWRLLGLLAVYVGTPLFRGVRPVEHAVYVNVCTIHYTTRDGQETGPCRPPQSAAVVDHSCV